MDPPPGGSIIFCPIVIVLPRIASLRYCNQGHAHSRDEMRVGGRVVNGTRL